MMHRHTLGDSAAETAEPAAERHAAAVGSPGQTKHKFGTHAVTFDGKNAPDTQESCLKSVDSLSTNDPQMQCFGFEGYKKKLCNRLIAIEADNEVCYDMDGYLQEFCSKVALKNLLERLACHGVGNYTAVFCQHMLEHKWERTSCYQHAPSYLTSMCERFAEKRVEKKPCLADASYMSAMCPEGPAGLTGTACRCKLHAKIADLDNQYCHEMCSFYKHECSEEKLRAGGIKASFLQGPPAKEEIGQHVDALTNKHSQAGDIHKCTLTKGVKTICGL
eukprot:TRINITY_DN9580_c0_g1_i7.p1 TRINITY_DN9580_c0_g1~~TRINITY_DN9580_c0_g1_i7.p1  ORF type:complete len:276 (+),score=59.05 TRINITY_DN9580_c0_g1_i7:449-1276(+)